MALEKDQERPTSPRTRKFFPENAVTSYMLDKPSGCGESSLSGHSGGGGLSNALQESDRNRQRSPLLNTASSMTHSKHFSNATSSTSE